MGKIGSEGLKEVRRQVVRLKKLGKAVNERTLPDYMKRWSMSCQRPAKRAKAEKSIVYWADETAEGFPDFG